MNTEYLRQIAQKYFTFTRSERYGVITLCSLLFLVIVANSMIGLFDHPAPADFTEFKKLIAEWEAEDAKEAAGKAGRLFMFDPGKITEEELDSLAIPPNIKSNMIKYRNKGGRFYNKESVRKLYGMNDSVFSIIEPYLLFEDSRMEVTQSFETHEELSTPVMFRFDPNLASAEEFEKLGFTGRQANTIIKYREKGGKFREEKDLRKIYGIDSVTFEKVRAWIYIENADTLTPARIIPKVEVTAIELNSADSASLVGLPGIGPVLASRIIRFRNALGGFYEHSQLFEIFGFSAETFELVKNKITIDTVIIRKVSLNFSEYDELSKHPYISGDEAKSIVKCRNKNGSFETCGDLVSKKVLDVDKFNKLRPYLKTD